MIISQKKAAEETTAEQGTANGAICLQSSEQAFVLARLRRTASGAIRQEHQG